MSPGSGRSTTISPASRIGAYSLTECGESAGILVSEVQICVLVGDDSFQYATRTATSDAKSIINSS